MPPLKPSPETRADRLWGEEVEMDITETVLYRLADAVDALVRGGALYGQVILTPEEAEMKRQAMQQAPLQGGPQ